MFQESTYSEEGKPVNCSPLNKAQYKFILPFKIFEYQA